MRCPRSSDAGAYVLGALTPTERSGYGRHLTSCDQCRDEVTELAGLPGMLGRLDGSAVADVAGPQASGPADLLPALLRRAATERRRARWRLVLAGCAALVLVVALTGVTLLRVTTPRVTTTTTVATHAAVLTPMRAVGTGPAIEGQIALEGVDGGTRIDMHCVYLDSSAFEGEWHLTLVLYPRGGGPSRTVLRWAARAGDDITVTAQVALRPADVGAIEVRKGDGSVVLRYDPA